MKKELLSQIENACKPILARAGYTLLDLEVFPGKEPRVVVVIYKPEGVSIGDCEKVTSLLSDEVDQFFAGRYHLEVSSPGLDRELKKVEEFQLFRGREARIFLKRPLEGEDILEGVLEGLEGENLKFLFREKTLQIPLENIQKARLLFK
ncbi:MAG: ribosome maturation factor RimP [Caldiserica bacterium]|nr:ribosome maturation factor RimP [Caldisericota bacterium]